MSRQSKGPFPREMRGQYLMWNGQYTPVTISMANGWYAIRYADGWRERCGLQVGNCIHALELQRRINRGEIIIDMSTESEVAIQLPNLEEVL